MSRADPLTFARIAERDPAFALEAVERLGVGEIVAVVVGDRDRDRLAGTIAAGEDRLAGADGQRHVAADEIEPGVAHQRARQQTDLGQHLETVADAEHRHAALGRLDHRATIGERAAIAPQRR